MTTRGPFDPIKTSLSFAALQGLLNPPGTKTPGAFRCGMCGHPFDPTDTSPDHDCKPPVFHIEVVEVKPMEAPLGRIFYMDSKYDPSPEDPK